MGQGDPAGTCEPSGHVMSGGGVGSQAASTAAAPITHDAARTSAIRFISILLFSHPIRATKSLQQRSLIEGERRGAAMVRRSSEEDIP